jgi:polar amino acid transport system substrate-binding protein
MHDVLYIKGTKFLGQIQSTPDGFLSAKWSLAEMLTSVVNDLIANGELRQDLRQRGISPVRR